MRANPERGIYSELAKTHDDGTVWRRPARDRYFNIQHDFGICSLSAGENFFLFAARLRAVSDVLEEHLQETGGKREVP